MLEQKAMEDLISSYKKRLLSMGYTEDQSNKLSAILLEMYLYQRKGIIKDTLHDVENSNYGWYVQSDTEPTYYLHSDGELHYGTDYAGEWSGYFKTEQEALDAKSKYEQGK